MLTHHDARVCRHGLLHGLGLDLLIEQALFLHLKSHHGGIEESHIYRCHAWPHGWGK